MKPAASTFPPSEFETPRGTAQSIPRDLWRLTLWLALLFGAAIAVNLAMRWSLPLPFCLLRETTGIPCPACGSTRSLAAWATLDLALAFRFNPLFFLACVGFALWTLLRTVEGFSRWRISERIRDAVTRLPLLRISIVSLVANWVYLYLTLPR